MDPTPELIASATEVVKIAAGAIPFTALARRILGPAADELAEAWRDEVRVYRYGRQLKLLEKAEKMAIDAGFTPRAVPIKSLFPLLEGASLEENEDLHTMWAALLANAANPETPDLVHPSFAKILSQITAQDASLLERIYDDAELFGKEVDPMNIGEPHFVLTGMGVDWRRTDPIGEQYFKDEAVRISINVLQSHFLVESRFSEVQINFSGVRRIYLTVFGIQFLRACRAPLLKS